MSFEINTLVILLIIALAVSLYFIGSLVFKIFLKKRKNKTLKETLELLQNEVIELELKVKETSNSLKKNEERLDWLIELEKNKNNLQSALERMSEEKANLSDSIDKLKNELSQMELKVEDFKRDITLYRPEASLIKLGFFEEPNYLYDKSDSLKEEINKIRGQQKKLIKDKNAIIIPDSIALTNDSTLSKSILKGQVDLMLKTFNIEVDNLISSVKPGNYPLVLEKINKLASSIEKSAVSFKCGFNETYIGLKFKECQIFYQYKLKKQREDEEQAIIKEQIREEEKARREFERAIAKAEKEEQIYQDALKNAKNDLEKANEEDKGKLNEKILLLQKQLEDAINDSQRAKSMAEQTKRGHVYIISNLGSFGENVYKIGLTRRLEPMDRVKELGDASVPFLFDVHAMLFSENAPELEKRLHEEFEKYRVNKINLRKEFFNVDIKKIKTRIEEHFGDAVDFTLTAKAEEYYQSIKLVEDEKISN